MSQIKFEGKDVSEITLVRDIVLPPRITGGRGKRGQNIKVEEFDDTKVVRLLLYHKLAVIGKVAEGSLPPAPGSRPAAKAAPAAKSTAK